MSEISNNNEYIPRAERRNKDGLTEKEFLEQYNPGHYERPSVTVDMLLFGNQLSQTKTDEIVETIMAQVKNGAISLERIIEANERIARLNL